MVLYLVWTGPFIFSTALYIFHFKTSNVGKQFCSGSRHLWLCKCCYVCIGGGILEAQKLTFGGHMVAVMALMESPAIIVGVILLNRYQTNKTKPSNFKNILHHSLTNGSVLMILGSLLIGIVADSKQAEGIKPFTTDIFKGFLAIFLLEMGMITAKRISSFKTYGWFLAGFAILIPAINGCSVAYLSGFITADIGNRFIFAILAGSASYIAVPAAMRIAAPESDPGLYLPMALGLTFPFNITLGMPLYYSIIQNTF